MRERVYDVFARKDRGESLRHVGSVDAPSDDLARIHAWQTYDEEHWFEMYVVPRDSIIAVNRSHGSVVGRVAGRHPVMPEMSSAQPYGGEG